jgi:hypothetical protein
MQLARFAAAQGPISPLTLARRAPPWVEGERLHSLVDVDPPRRWRAPDCEVSDGRDQVATPFPVRLVHEAVEGDQDLGLLPSGDPSRKDVALKPTQIAEADALVFDCARDEVPKDVPLIETLPALENADEQPNRKRVRLRRPECERG